MREGDSALDDMISEIGTAAEVLDLFKKIQDSVMPQAASFQEASAAPSRKDISAEGDYDEEIENPNLTRMFTFSTLAHVNKLARLAGNSYNGINSLYKDDAYGTYILIVTKGSHTKEEYNRFCNMVSEYATMHKSKPATERFLEEHFAPIIKDNALQTLAEL